MLIKNAADIPSSEITNERLYLHRREFMRLTTGALASAAGAAVLAACGRGSAEPPTTTEKATGGESPFPPVARRLVTTQDPPNTFEQITGYNNFYEFGTGKGDPASTRDAEHHTVDGDDRRRCATSPGTITSKISSRPPSWRSESTAIAASRRGRW